MVFTWILASRARLSHALAVNHPSTGTWLVWLAMLSLAALTTTAPAAWAQPAAYSGAEIRARVVDAETRQPLEGVFVVAKWELTLLLSRASPPLHLMEAVTDAKGEFYFPAWGPKPRPTFSSLWGGDPRMVFFRPGYDWLSRSNATEPDDSPVRTSRWHGQTIELTPFRGTIEVWAILLKHLQLDLRWGSETNEYPFRINDYWKHYPRTILALLEAIRRLPASLEHQPRTLDSWQVSEEQLREAARQKGETR
jgi:hypothetical protein